MTTAFGQTLWNLVTWFFQFMPWLIMALLAGMAWLKNKKSMPLLLEMFGALAVFALSVLRWLILAMMNWSHASFDVYRAAVTIFTFLYVVALLVFAAGFCWEKFSQWRGGAARGFPVT